MKSLSGFGWFVAGLVIAPACYLVSSQVAGERSRVEAVERAIARANKDIRELETEFDTRANLAQLERWNGEVMRYTAPTPRQFLSSDTALASLRPLEGDGLAERYAAMVVPAGVPNVVTGVTETATDTVRAGSPAATAPVPAPSKVASTKAASGGALVDAVVKPARAATGAARVVVKDVAKNSATAMLDRKLLKDSSFGDLMQGVRAEATKIR